MWRLGVFVAVLLLTQVVAGCLGSNEPELGPGRDGLHELPDQIAFSDGDRGDWALEGTGFFRIDLRPTEHVNLRFEIEHDEIDDWCQGGHPHPLLSEGGFVMAGLAPELNEISGGAWVILAGHSEDHQSGSRGRMDRDDGCNRSQMRGFSSQETATVFVATTIPGLRLTVYDQHADQRDGYMRIPMTPFPTPPAVPMTATETGVARESGQYVQWTTTWSHSVQTEPAAFLLLTWFDAEPMMAPGPVPRPLNPGYYDVEFRLKIERTNATGTETVENRGGGGGSGGGGGNGDSARLFRAVADEPALYEIELTHSETRVQALEPPRELGTWLITVPFE